VLDSYEAERRPVALATVQASGELHDANVLTGAAAAARDRSPAAALASPTQVLAAVEAAHELPVAYRDSPIVAGDAPAGAPGVLPGQRIPDAGPLVLHDGSRTSLRELLRSPELQLWICAGSGAPGEAPALAERFAPAVRAMVLVIADRPPPDAPPQVGVVADPELRVHGRLGAVADTAYVVRPDGHLGFRCEPPDAARLAKHLAVLGDSAYRSR
jgi:hypothetical protein